MIYIILVEPEHPGNIGAVARAMKNFDFNNLILINPVADHLCDDAFNRAKHAKDVLKKAKVADFPFLDKMDYLIGTTGKLGRSKNLPRTPLTPEQMCDKLDQIDKRKKIGILIGREGIGLLNKEIQQCDFTVTIPTVKKYPILNISHATAIILYEMHKRYGKEDITKIGRSVSRKEKDALMGYINRSLDKVEFGTKEKRETQRKLWKKVLGKATLTSREAAGLMGYFRKLR